VFRVTDSGAMISEGPAPGHPGNVFRNNILATGGKSMIQFPAPWRPAGCDTKGPRVTFAANIFQFDGKDTAAISTCPYSCGQDFDKAQSFQGNLYWRGGGGFAADPKAFSVMTTAPGNAARCVAPVDPSALKFLSFSQWQGAGFNEDRAGTATVDPKFGKSGKPADYMLSKSPVAGFDVEKTNDTIRNAGRSHAVIMPPKVAATFPSY